KVVDYKTYGAGFDPSLVEKGLNTQLLIYIFSLWKGRNGSSAGIAGDGDVIPAGAVYYSVKRMEATADSFVDEDQARRVLEQGIERSGLILEEDNIPDAMFPGAKDVNKKNGTTQRVGLSYTTVVQFGELYEKVESAVKMIAGNMKKGVGAVDPVDDENAKCQWCPGKRICKHAYAYAPKGW
ncbi:MAG: PD-(D/E)XK nuclease family protein, partial [Clostridia bacterium]|nr:PD-(D/E)XK nuclease family protein [Clostridia bacterium]